MLSPVEERKSMHDIIFEAVTKKREAVQETARECKKLFKDKKDPADPNVLIQLEEVLRARQNEQTIKKYLESSKSGASPEALAELEKSAEKKREDYKYYIKDFLPQLKKEITQSKKLDPTKRVEIEKIIMELITLDAVSKNDNKDHSDSTMQNQNTTAGAVEVQSGANTSKLSNDNGSDSGVSSREESLESPISSRRSSMSSILSSAGENNDPQKEDTGNQMQPEQTAEEEPQVSSQCVTLGSREKESMDPNSQTTQMTGSQAKDSMQPKEKKDKKNVITTVQKLPVNEKKGEVKQPNNRNLHIALVAGCALSTIGCIVAGVMTSGLVGAGLLAMVAVFAIAAVAELHSNFLSSKLTSISVEPHVNDKELTACSHL